MSEFSRGRLKVRMMSWGTCIGIYGPVETTCYFNYYRSTMDGGMGREITRQLLIDVVGSTNRLRLAIKTDKDGGISQLANKEKPMEDAMDGGT